MLKGTAPIRYGHPPAPPVGYFEAEEKLFPNAVTRILGGCIIEDVSDQNVTYCPLCREARKSWIGDNPERNWLS